MKSKYAKPVREGMRAVNADKGEGWVDDFDLESFDMSSTRKCVLGQLYPGYSEGLTVLMYAVGSAGGRWRFAISHGFDLENSGIAKRVSWNALQRQWEIAITAQKEARAHG